MADGERTRTDEIAETPDAATARLRRLLFIAWTLLGVAALGLVVLGVLVVRRPAPRVVRVFGDAAVEQALARQHTRGAVWLDANPDVGYRPLPSDVRFGTNRLGFRGPDWREPKAAGERRVLLLGDSVTYGLGVAPDETFAARLADRLAARAPAWRVYTAAAPAWNVRQEVALLLTNLDAIQPDVVLHQVLRNDYYHARAPVFNSWGHAYGLENLRSGEPFYTELTASGAWEAYQAAGRAVAVPRELFLRLPEYGAIRRAHIAPLRAAADALARAGVTYVLWHYRGDDAEATAAFRADLRALGVRAYYFENRYTAPLADDPHPNAATHARIADELLGALAELPDTGLGGEPGGDAPTLSHSPDGLASGGAPPAGAAALSAGLGARIDLTTGENYDQVIAGMWRVGWMLRTSEFVLRRRGEAACVIEYEVASALAPQLPADVTVTVSDFAAERTQTFTVEAPGAGAWRVPLDGLARDAVVRVQVRATAGVADPTYKHVEAWRLVRATLSPGG